MISTALLPGPVTQMTSSLNDVAQDQEDPPCGADDRDDCGDVYPCSVLHGAVSHRRVTNSALRVAGAAEVMVRTRRLAGVGSGYGGPGAGTPDPPDLERPAVPPNGKWETEVAQGGNATDRPRPQVNCLQQSQARLMHRRARLPAVAGGALCNGAETAVLDGYDEAV